jgi:NTE family protein
MRALYLTIIGLLHSECSSFNYDKADSPTPLVSVLTFVPKPKITLMLGSGGPRGFVHIGVMKLLEESGIGYDLVLGSRVGSLIRGFWNPGYTASETEKHSNQGDPFPVCDFSLFADRGWIHGQRLQNYVNDKLGNLII